MSRPTADEPWLLLSKQCHGQIDGPPINDAWTEAFGDEFPEITSHYGRHRFTTYWRVEQGVDRDLVKYMRGDKTGTPPGEEPTAIDTYIHTYYEDVEELYLDRIFQLGL